MKWVKQNWFKITILVLIIIFLFLYNIPLYFKYQDFKTERKCTDATRIIKMLIKGDLEDKLEFYSCVLKYPSLEERYTSILNAYLKSEQDKE